MGYTTNFVGQIAVNPPLNAAEVDWFNKNISNPTNRHDTAWAPSFYCQWLINETGSIEWDGEEKFYAAEEWMEFLISLFTGQLLLTNPMPWRHGDDFTGFTWEHNFNGTIEAQGEEVGDHWLLIVKDSVVTRVDMDGETFLKHLEAMGHDHPDQAILDVPMDPEDNDAQASSIREYLKAWTIEVWDNPPKRVFGSSGWRYDVAKSLIQAGVVPGVLDDDGYVGQCDMNEVDEIMYRAIEAL